jgi:hypothetical protein
MTVKAVKIRIWSYEHDRCVWAEVNEGDTESCPMEVKQGSRDDEGYSYTIDRYWLDGGRVMATHDSHSCDCDGRLNYWTRSVWNEETQAWDGLDDGDGFSEGQRDFRAEAAGY